MLKRRSNEDESRRGVDLIHRMARRVFGDISVYAKLRLIEALNV